MVFDNRIFNDVDIGPEAHPKENVNLEAELARNEDMSDEINNQDDMREAFSQIQEEVPRSSSSADLTELFRQAGSLIKLLDKTGFKEKVGAKIDEIQEVADHEFARTAQALNRRAAEVGAKSHYAEKWGG